MKKAESKTCDKYKVDFKDNTNKAVILNVNELLKKYIHDIRNINVLDEEMLNNIRIMSDDDKMNIIIALNDVIKHLKLII